MLSTAQILSAVGLTQVEDRYGYSSAREGDASLQLRPGINADIGDTKSKGWEVLGTNGTSALATFAAGGGITLTTAGAAADQMILAPHLDTGVSPLTGITWSTSDELGYYLRFTTGASVAAATIWAGFKLTNTPVVATDDNAVFFRYDASESTKMKAVTSIGGSDTQFELNDLTIEASTTYELAIWLDSTRRPFFYHRVAGSGWKSPAHVGSALTAAIDLIPYVGVQADAAAAKAITVREIGLGKAEND